MGEFSVKISRLPGAILVKIEKPCSIAAKVTVRLLPRWLGLEASGEFGIVNEVIEEAVPGLGGATCFSKHI